MGYERTHIFQKKSTHTPQPTSQFSSRPFEAPVQRKPKEQMTPDELENEAFDQNKFEAFGLQLKAESGTITPVEQERLGVLQAKMDDFWAQRRERASRLSYDFSKVSVHPPEGYPTPRLQPMWRQGTPGVPMGGQRSLLNSPQQSSVSPLQAKLTIGEPGDKYEQEADQVASQVVEQINSPKAAQSTQGQSVQRQEEPEEELQRQPSISELQRSLLSPEVQQLKTYQDINSQARTGGVPVVQRAERQTTLYARHGEQWQKNMQIIDSDNSSDYVHVSRSTTTDPENIHQHNLPDDIRVVVGVANKRQRVETANDDNPNFDRAQYTAANNVHITLEGRYMKVMRTLATEMFDNREAIKNGPPVGDFANLNFGDFEAQGEQQVSNYGIQQWIEIVADDTEDFLRTNVEEEYQNQVPELIEVVNEVKDSTLNFTNDLIATTPALNELEQNNNLVHYGGAPWART